METAERQCDNCKHGSFGKYGKIYGGRCLIPLPGPLQRQYHINHSCRRVEWNYVCTFWEPKDSEERK